MHHRFTWKSKTIKCLEGNIGKRSVQNLVRTSQTWHQKHDPKKKKNQYTRLHQNEIFLLCERKILLRRWKDKQQIGRKYFQTTYLAKASYPEFIKNSENSTVIIIFKIPVRKWAKDKIFKKLNILLPYNTAVLLLPGIYPSAVRTGVPIKTIPDCPTAALSGIVKDWKQSKGPSTSEGSNILWSTHSMERYSEEKKKKNELLIHRQCRWISRALSNKMNPKMHMLYYSIYISLLK